MALSTLLSSLDKASLILYSSALYLLFLTLCHLSNPLKSIPGPFLARFTRLWELHAVRKGDFEKTHYKLHERYGPIVQLAPNKYSISDPEEADQIYHHGSQFIKADFYHAFGNPDPVDADAFSERDTERHAFKRRKVSSLYSMSALVSYEGFVDRCNAVLCQKMHGFAGEVAAFEVPAWMQFYAFDVIGEMSVGQSFGFMQKGYDFNGILKAIHSTMTYGSRVGLFAELHPCLVWIARAARLPVPFATVQAFIEDSVESCRQGDFSIDRNDFLTKLSDLRKSGKINDLDVATSLGANIAAGSDTTAIILSTIIYYLAKSPEKAKKLRCEIQVYEEEGSISDPVTFREAQEMPYLQAVIKEALRIHPVTGQILSRIVPAGGATICGRYFPAGTEVGTSPWLTHFNQDIFGAEPRSFIPERWLDDDGRAAKMNQHMLAFGAGSRTCLGKNISMLAMTKIIPQLYRRFDFELVKPEEEWELDMVWLVKQSFKCRVKVL